MPAAAQSDVDPQFLSVESELFQSPRLDTAGFPRLDVDQGAPVPQLEGVAGEVAPRGPVRRVPAAPAPGRIDGRIDRRRCHRVERRGDSRASASRSPQRRAPCATGGCTPGSPCARWAAAARATTRRRGSSALTRSPRWTTSAASTARSRGGKAPASPSTDNGPSTPIDATPVTVHQVPRPVNSVVTKPLPRRHRPMTAAVDAADPFARVRSTVMSRRRRAGPNSAVPAVAITLITPASSTGADTAAPRESPSPKPGLAPADTEADSATAVQATAVARTRPSRTPTAAGMERARASRASQLSRPQLSESGCYPMIALVMTFGSLGALGLITAIGFLFTGRSSTTGADGAPVLAENGARNSAPRCGACQGTGVMTVHERRTLALPAAKTARPNARLIRDRQSPNHQEKNP